jgi:DNA-binding NarL/FixJ family response regulator
LAPDPEQQRIRELFRRLAEASDPAELKSLRAELRHLLTARAFLQKPSPQQLRVIEMVALGLKNREIAENLGTSEQLVKNHLHKIYAKIRVENRLKLALWYEQQVYEGKVQRRPDLLLRRE